MDDEFINPNDLYRDDDNTDAHNPGPSEEVSKDRLHRAVGYLVAVLGLVVSAYFYSGSSWFSPTNQQANQAAPEQTVTKPKTAINPTIQMARKSLLTK